MGETSEIRANHQISLIIAGGHTSAFTVTPGGPGATTFYPIVSSYASYNHYNILPSRMRLMPSLQPNLIVGLFLPHLIGDCDTGRSSGSIELHVVDGIGEISGTNAILGRIVKRGRHN